MMAGDPLTHVAPALRLLLREKGKIQAEVAETMGAGRSQVSRYFSGKVVPNLENLLHLLGAMDADLNELQLAMERSKGVMNVEMDIDELLGAIEVLAGNDSSLLRMFLYIVDSLNLRIDFSQTGMPNTDQLAVLYETSLLVARLVTRYSDQLSRAKAGRGRREKDGRQNGCINPAVAMWRSWSLRRARCRRRRR